MPNWDVYEVLFSPSFCIICNPVIWKSPVTVALVISSISNIRGAASTVIEITVQPSSNDVVPVRDQIVEIDVANSIITVEEDTFVGGSAEAGVGYTTSTSY